MLRLYNFSDQFLPKECEKNVFMWISDDPPYVQLVEVHKYCCQFFTHKISLNFIPRFRHIDGRYGNFLFGTSKNTPKLKKRSIAFFHIGNIFSKNITSFIFYIGKFHFFQQVKNTYKMLKRCPFLFRDKILLRTKVTVLSLFWETRKK